jgi:hypothetical protein
VARAVVDLRIAFAIAEARKAKPSNGFVETFYAQIAGLAGWAVDQALRLLLDDELQSLMGEALTAWLYGLTDEQLIAFVERGDWGEGVPEAFR